MLVVAVILGLVLAGSWVYCVLIAVAVRRYLDQPIPPLTSPPPVSILKPLAGADEGLAANLRSFFEQRYPAPFEVLFAVRRPDDPAIAVAEKVRHGYPRVPSQILITGDPPYPNAKVYSLDCMLREARYDIVVMSDSDVRVTPDLLRTVSAELVSGGAALATCPYRAVAGPSLPSQLEGVGMNTEFLGGMLVARLIEGVRFAVGPTIAAKRDTIDKIGGFDRLKDFLAEDFVMGKFAAEAGFSVILSRYVIEHRIGSEPWAPNAVHRIRWNRSTRRSRPAGYAGQLFTNPLPIAVLMVLMEPHWWPALIPSILFRAWAAYAAATQVLQTRVRWGLLLLQDFLSFGFWLAGFFGNTIVWRGRRYYLRTDGTFIPK